MGDWKTPPSDFVRESTELSPRIAYFSLDEISLKGFKDSWSVALEINPTLKIYPLSSDRRPMTTQDLKAADCQIEHPKEKKDFQRKPKSDGQCETVRRESKTREIWSRWAGLLSKNNTCRYSRRRSVGIRVMAKYIELSWKLLRSILFGKLGDERV